MHKELIKDWNIKQGIYSTEDRGKSVIYQFTIYVHTLYVYTIVQIELCGVTKYFVVVYEI